MTLKTLRTRRAPCVFTREVNAEHIDSRLSIFHASTISRAPIDRTFKPPQISRECDRACGATPLGCSVESEHNSWEWRCRRQRAAPPLANKSPRAPGISGARPPLNWTGEERATTRLAAYRLMH